MKVKRKKQTLDPLKGDSQLPIRKKKLPKDELIPLPLDPKGRKTKAQILFDEMMKEQEADMENEDELMEAQWKMFEFVGLFY